MRELFQMGFFQNALFMGIILGMLFGLLSFFIVIRRMAFLGAGISHTAFGGVALGIFLGWQPFIITAVFCMASALIIGRMVRHKQIAYDSAIGIFFSLSMALGALLISLRKAYTFDLSGYLFGNILGINTADLWIASALMIVFLFLYFGFFQKLLFASLDERAASTAGVNTNMLESVLLAFLALVIVVSIKMVGIILVSALVVLPASFGLLCAKNYRQVLIISAIYAMVIMTGGLFLSFFLNTPAGATIVVLGSIAYFGRMIL